MPVDDLNGAADNQRIKPKIIPLALPPERPLERSVFNLEASKEEDWHALIRRQHEALMRRLDLQDNLLHRLLSSAASEGAGGFSGSPSISALNSATPSGFKGSGREDGVPPSLPSPKQSKSKGSLLTSYTVEDLAHKDEALTTHGQYSRSKFNKRTDKAGQVDTDGCVKKMVRHQAFEAFFAAVVITNAVFIGLDVQFAVGADSEAERSSEMQIIGYVYTGLFTAELGFRLWEGGCRFFCNDDWMWGWLDLFIVLSSLWEVALDVIQYFYQSQGDLEAIPGISNMKSFRIIRLTRLLKTAQFVRIFRFVMALRMLVTSIISTLKALLWAMVLLALIVYVFAVLFTQEVNDFLLAETSQQILTELERQDLEKHFGSLMFSMLSLFMSIAGGVSWQEVIRPLLSMSTVWCLCYLFYIMFTYFAVLNVITGVFCQSAIESAQNDHSMVVQALMDNKAAHIQKLRDLFYHLNHSNNEEANGVITLGLFEEKINTPAVKEYFEALGLDIWDAWSFFKLLDAAGDGAVDLEVRV
ncbi:Voltage-dependent L-type calcium channel subunit alpha-1F [Symbiodinium microadriaticum]|uniref:Voltage-dependent L-type calcium channel subunit alpha-1F n=1 Tax=Symbiodinium microadriaticum TaxID=2951 RepID=A0A1Q9CYI2_SYMMI|nr:Voltage-dependent L-type calcium channel subunit alpha-1F [Symbiodinium microadriaticum]